MLSKPSTCTPAVPQGAKDNNTYPRWCEWSQALKGAQRNSGVTGRPHTEQVAPAFDFMLKTVVNLKLPTGDIHQQYISSALEL